MAQVKFEYGDWVSFKLHQPNSDPIKIVGQVAIVDTFGTFFQNEEPSYDVYADHCLYKHLPQSGLTFVKKGDGTCAIENI